MRMIRLAAAAVCLGMMGTAQGAQEKLLFGFESEQEASVWSGGQAKLQLVDQHATQGKNSLKISTGQSMVCKQPLDWSAGEELAMDVFVEGDQPAQAWTYIGDQEWDKKQTYWNQHDGAMVLRPGKNTVYLPTTGLFRGEQGSRNNDIKSNIDPAKIVYWSINFTADKKQQRNVYVDNIRLIKSDPRPNDVWAFDLGPDSQAVCPGFTAVGPSMVYGKDGNKVGLKAAANPGLARDSTFPTRLYQDYIMMEGNEFIVDLPNGRYDAWVVYENAGYWGGETARFKQRTISANGQVVDTEDRGEAGVSEYLFAFENVEPKPGDNLWDLYVKHLVQPRKFQVNVTDGKLALAFQGGSILNSKVAAIVIYPAASQTGAKWVADVEQRNQEEFLRGSVYAGPFASELNVPESARAKQYWLGYPSLEQNVTLADAPGAADPPAPRRAALDQRVSMTFAVRPLKDFSQVKLTATDLKGDAGSIPSANVDLRYVHHSASRIAFTQGFTISPQTLRPVDKSELKLGKDFTRQFWVTVHVPSNAKAGKYSGQVRLDAGDLDLVVPIAVDVLAVKLDEPDYSMGFYGVDLPVGLPLAADKGWRMLMSTLHDNGMNSFTGGPSLLFKGLDANGKPIIDGYDKVDEFFRVCRELGFNHTVMDYGGPGAVRGLHDGYVIGQTGRNWEQKTGKNFSELLKIVWTDVRDHAQKNNWLPIVYGMTDEPRVLENAQEQLELMKAYKQAVPFVKIGGSYSVHWGKDDPLDKAIQEIFKTLDWSALNVHSQTDVDKTKEFGKELWIYNQGVDRFSFGAYQWAEMSKGVKGRMQWHNLAISGYQYLDLDGREPDFAAIMWGKDQIYPTLRLSRCREGADDLRYAVTLWNLAEKNQGKPEAKVAMDWLKQISASIPAGQRQPVEALKGEAFRDQCIQHLQKLMQ